MSKAIKPKTAIIYGGTFDPLHNGHLLCVDAAKATFPHAQVHIYPTYAPLTDATIVRKQPLLSFAERVSLLQRHFATDAKVLVSSLEKDLPAPNLTYNLVQTLRRLYPHTKLMLLFGQDQYQHFAAWEGARAMLLSGCDLAIINRPQSVPISEITTALAQELTLTLLYKQGCYRHKKFSIYSISPPQLAVSSTDVRQAIRNQQQLDNIPAVVADYLKQRF